MPVRSMINCCLFGAIFGIAIVVGALYNLSIVPDADAMPTVRKIDSSSLPEAITPPIKALILTYNAEAVIVAERLNGASRAALSLARTSYEWQVLVGILVTCASGWLAFKLSRLTPNA